MDSPWYFAPRRWLVLSLILTLGVLGYAYLFSPGDSNRDLNSGDNPLLYPLWSETFFKQQVQLTVKNKVGETRLQRDTASDGLGWRVGGELNLPVNQEVWSEFVSTLTALKPQKLLPFDALSEITYLLNTPICEMEFTSEVGEKIGLKFGLMNSIDQTMYVGRKDLSLIYQLPLIQLPLSQLGQAYFVEPRIFYYFAPSWKEMSYVSGGRSIHQKDWVIRPSTSQELSEYLKILSIARATLILESLNPVQKEEVEKLWSPSTGRFMVTTSHNEVLEIKLSRVFYGLNHLSVDKGEWVLASINRDNESIYPPFLIPFAKLKPLFKKPSLPQPSN